MSLCIYPRKELLVCVLVLTLIWCTVSVHTMDLHSCFNSTYGIKHAMSVQKCQHQCQIGSTCSGVSFCRLTGICHVMFTSLEADGVVDRNCPGNVVILKENINQLKVAHRNVNTTSDESIGCKIDIPEFDGCDIFGNMYHVGHIIKVQCDLMQHTCRNSTFICNTDGAWTFEDCLISINIISTTCVSNTILTAQFTNVARGQPVSMSSQYNDISPGSLMVDGVRNNRWPCACTRHEDQPTMIVDLENIYTIHGLYMLNRYDCCADRLRDFDISFGERMTTLSLRIQHIGAVNQDCTFRIDPPVRAQYVKIQINGREFLTICELEIYGL